MSFLLDDSDTQLFIPEILAMLDFDKASWSMNFVKEEPLLLPQAMPASPSRRCCALALPVTLRQNPN
ncbi:hypothetical protein GQ600_8167 [Phytophthora cactorum]|nr:hypothetical protein GQ600_8167 [Phytophthora cactorum]